MGMWQIEMEPIKDWLDGLDGFLACKPGISMPGLHAFSYC